MNWEEIEKKLKKGKEEKEGMKGKEENGINGDRNTGKKWNTGR